MCKINKPQTDKKKSRKKITNMNEKWGIYINPNVINKL